MRSAKIIAVFVAAFFFLIATAPKARAADVSSIDCSIFKTNANIWDAINNPRWVSDTFTSILVGPLSMTITGTDFETNCKCAKALSASNSTDEMGKNADCKKANTFLASSGIGLSSRYALTLLDSGRDLVNAKYYAYDMAKNLPFYKGAMAAENDNYWAINIILDVWKKVRNVTYIFFVLVFVAVGFMIMFRKKVDPQTVVTIQNSLPRIVIALILITFSYPIAALIFNLSTPLSDFVKAQFFPDLNFATMTGAILASLLLILVGILVGVALSTVVGSPILGIAVAVLFVVLGFALIFAYIYIGWTWLTRIGKLIFLTLAAPFILLVGALPGNEKSIFNWVKSLLSLALQLPAIWFVMYLGVKILSYYYAHPIAAALHGAPIVGFLTAPIIAIWILYQVGKVPKLVDEALGVELMFGGSGGGKKK